jgi:hypothetical protein
MLNSIFRGGSGNLEIEGSGPMVSNAAEGPEFQMYFVAPNGKRSAVRRCDL